MITSNALGHFMYSRTTNDTLDDQPKLWALENAMRTIGNAYSEKRLKHTPATFLSPAAEGKKCPLKNTSEFSKHSTDSYRGYFHTDHLIPSVFFDSIKMDLPRSAPPYEGLDLHYIYDATADPEEHRELMAGQPATWYEVRRNIDRLPGFANPEKQDGLPTQIRARLARWLEDRNKRRAAGG